MRVGAVLVHYRTPDLCASALEALRADAEGSDLGLRAVLVDNGSDESGRARLDALAEAPDVQIRRPRENLGFAGGVNLGVRELGDCDVHLLMNPDVRVGPGCLAALVAALGRGAAAAGPKFFWDRPGGVVLPPTERVGRRHELGRVLARRRGGFWARRARAAWRRHAQRHWTAEHDIESWDLSGALVAVTADAWELVGPFDEAFRLYFEETDWLQRLRARGVAARYVPTAHAVHDYASSTPQEPRSPAWFTESEARFRRRWYGERFTRMIEGGPDAGTGPERPPDTRRGRDPTADRSTRWVEISSSPLGFPAGATFHPEGLEPEEDPLPDIAFQRAADGVELYWRTVDASGRESALVRIEAP